MIIEEFWTDDFVGECPARSVVTLDERDLIVAKINWMKVKFYKSVYGFTANPFSIYWMKFH